VGDQAADAARAVRENPQRTAEVADRAAEGAGTAALLSAFALLLGAPPPGSAAAPAR
jgi:hypothetical protein